MDFKTVPIMLFSLGVLRSKINGNIQSQHFKENYLQGIFLRIMKIRMFNRKVSVASGFAHARKCY